MPSNRFFVTGDKMYILWSKELSNARTPSLNPKPKAASISTKGNASTLYEDNTLRPFISCFSTVIQAIQRSKLIG